MASNIPTGSSPSGSTGRPRAQVAYEGEDEFSVMSMEPSREEALKNHAALAGKGGASEPVKVDELRPTNGRGVLGMLRRIFAR
jgi:hypothetical protein